MPRTATSKGGRPASLLAFFALTTILPLSPLILRLSRQQQRPQHLQPPTITRPKESDTRSLTNGTMSAVAAAASDAVVGSAANEKARPVTHGVRERWEQKRKQHRREGISRRAERTRGGDDDRDDAPRPVHSHEADAGDASPTTTTTTTATVTSSAAAETAAASGKVRPDTLPGGTPRKPRLRDGTAGRQRGQAKGDQSRGREDREVAPEGGRATGDAEEGTEEDGAEEERCVPVSECELCPTQVARGTAVPAGCAPTNRRRRFECRTASVTDGRRYGRYLPCERTSEDENYLVMRMQFICLVIGALAMYVVRREKSLHGTSFDKRVLAARNKISRRGGDSAATGTGPGTSEGGVGKKKKKKKKKGRGGGTLSDYAYHSVAGAIIDEEEDDDDEYVEDEATSVAVDRTPPPASGNAGDLRVFAEVEGCQPTLTTTTTSGVPTNFVRMASV